MPAATRENKDRIKRQVHGRPAVHIFFRKSRVGFFKVTSIYVCSGNLHCMNFLKRVIPFFFLFFSLSPFSCCNLFPRTLFPPSGRGIIIGSFRFSLVPFTVAVRSPLLSTKCFAALSLCELAVYLSLFFRPHLAVAVYFFAFMVGFCGHQTKNRS